MECYLEFKYIFLYTYVFAEFGSHKLFLQYYKNITRSKIKFQQTILETL